MCDKLVEEYINSLKKNHKLVSGHKILGKTGTGTYTFLQKGNDRLRGENASMVTYLKELEGHTVITHFLVEERTGWGSMPTESTEYGKQVGCMNLSAIISEVTDEQKAKAIAKKYLVRDPELLVSALSSTLNAQASVIKEQSSIISTLDWNLANAFEHGNAKFKRMVTLMFGGDHIKAYIPEFLKRTKELGKND